MKDSIFTRIQNYLIAYFSSCAEKSYPLWYRIASLIGTIILVFLLLPYVFIRGGSYFDPCPQLTMEQPIRISIGIIALALGLFLIVWTLILQYSYAGGSGSHMVPTQRCIITGPYGLCRHPMQIGAIIFYFGAGMLWASLFVAVFIATVTALAGYVLHRYIEEPVLIKRFGKEYQEYQKKVPMYPTLIYIHQESQ